MPVSARFWHAALPLLLIAALVSAALVLWQKFRLPELPPGFVSGNGRLEATEVDVTTRLAGRLLSVEPHEGEAVTRDQPVARLDPDELNAQLRAAEAQINEARAAQASAQAAVNRAESDRQLARSTLQRTRQLIAKGFLSAAQLDRDQAAADAADAAQQAARAGVQQAAAALAAAEAQRARVQAQLKDVTLTAPISGRVLYRLVEPGEVLGSGGKVLTLLDLGEVYMTIYLPSALAGKLPIKAEARLILDADPATVIPAELEFVADRAQFTPKDVETRNEREKLMFRAKVRVAPSWLADPEHAARLKPGMPGVAYVRSDASQPWPAQLPRR